MKTIILEIDDLSANDYDSFSCEMKKEIGKETTTAICKLVFDMRAKNIKKIVEQMNADTTENWLNPDIVLELLRIEV